MSKSADTNPTIKRDATDVGGPTTQVELKTCQGLEDALRTNPVKGFSMALARLAERVVQMLSGPTVGAADCQAYPRRRLFSLRRSSDNLLETDIDTLGRWAFVRDGMLLRVHGVGPSEAGHNQ